MQCPGGHIEYGESFAECAKREVLEETGLEIGDVKFLIATNDVFGEGKHYVTIFVTCRIVGEEKEPKVRWNVLSLSECGADLSSKPLEPEKCARWDWVSWSQMWAWARDQADAEAAGRKPGKQMFLPLVNLYREYPEMEYCLS